MRKTLEEAYQLAEKLKKLPKEEQARHFTEGIEAVRAEAIAKGFAIDEEYAAKYDGDQSRFR